MRMFEHEAACLNLFVLDTGKQVLLQTVKIQMKRPHMAAFHQDLHCVLRLKQSSLVSFIILLKV